jgi:NitT/TauT family transport system substrate-binding protein
MARHRPRHRMFYILMALLAIVAVSRASAEEPAKTPQHVSVRLNFLPGVEHAFLYLGKQKGWYAEAGIDLEVIPGQGSTVAVKTVGSGEDQFAIADTGSVARGWEAGVKLVYVAMLLKHTPAAIFSLPSRNIVSMKDLCGKKVGVNLRSTTAEQYHAMVRAAKLTCEIEEIPINSGGTKEVMTGAVDAAVNFSYTDALRVKLKSGANIVPATDYFDFFSLGIITNASFLAENEDLVRRFLKVTYRSLDYAFAHKDEAMAVFLGVVPEADQSFEAAKFDAFKVLMQDSLASSQTCHSQSQAGWEATMRSLREVGLTKSIIDPTGRFACVAEER